MNKNIIAALYKKEIRDILRDKKTMFMMIIIPLILYPLIFVASMGLMNSVMNAEREKTYRVSFEDVSDAGMLKGVFQEKGEEREYSFDFVDPKEGQNCEYLLENDLTDVYISESVSDNRPYYLINYMASETDSQTAAGMASRILDDHKEDLTHIYLVDKGISENEALKPIGYDMKDHASNEENVGYIMGMIVPFLLIVSIMMGAMYPAIDTTAGEKERGTLETLLTLPVNSREFICAKFLAVSTIAVGAALLNMISMFFLGIYMASSMDILSETGAGFDAVSFIPAIIVTLLCVISFALLSSALSLCVCIRAGSFKEAQNMTTPLMLVFMMAAMAGMLPSLELTNVTALIPVANISLLIASLFKLHFELELIMLVLLSNIAYTALAVLAMSRLFAAEDVLFGEEGASIKILERRSDIKKGTIPGFGDLVLLFSVILLIILFAGSLFILKFGIYGIIAEQFFILLAVLAYSIYIKVDMRKLLHLNPPGIKGLIGGIFIWAGGYLVLIIASDLLSYFIPELENDTALLEIWKDHSLFLVLLSSAFMPAVCEEMAFRGFMLGTFENRLKPAAAVVLTGLLFGAYHLSLLQFFVIGFSGILLTWVVFKTRSIFISMLMHFINNTAAVFIALYPEKVMEKIPFIREDRMPASMMAVTFLCAVLLLGAGYLLITRGIKMKTSGEESHP
ncbi:MAG: ABC transporter permease subunit [Lachnospiraceae bacterium]|nr:ABC transporter permease subunit [Lachnospiraceae bacterium]